MEAKMKDPFDPPPPGVSRFLGIGLHLVGGNAAEPSNVSGDEPHKNILKASHILDSDKKCMLKAVLTKGSCQAAPEPNNQVHKPALIR
jgi:hypothetical protein